MNKKILDSENAKKVAAIAIQTVAKSVKQTLGPKGNPIVIQRLGTNPDGTPIGPLITKDGVTVAEHTILRDPALSTFAQTIIQTAQNTVKEGGDGTTTSIILAEAIFNAGVKRVAQGTNSILLQNELKTIKDEIIEIINSIKQPVSEGDVIDVARVASNGDEEVAQIIYDAITAVGEDGYVSLQEGYTRETVLTKIKGAVYKQGWRQFGPLGSHQVTDKTRNICELDDPYVLLYAGKLENQTEFGEFIATVYGVAPNGSYANPVPLLIVANDYSDDMKTALMAMRINAKLPIAAIKSPFDGSPNARTEMLEDLSCILGGRVFAKNILELKDVQPEHLGQAEKIEVGVEETAILKGKGVKERIIDRLSDLRKRLEQENLDEYDQENTRLRMGKLSGGVAIIEVGGDSELEMNEKKDRIEDALCAAKVAIKDGIIAGGGYTLYKIAQGLKGDSDAVAIMKEALQAPIRQIITNSGKNPDVILSHMHNGYGYNAMTNDYCHLLEEGIVDPAKVTKAALENAVSIAGLLLITGGALVSDTETKDGTPNPFAGLLG